MTTIDGAPGAAPSSSAAALSSAGGDLLVAARGRLVDALSLIARDALRAALDVDEGDPDVRETSDPRFGDYQINGVLPLARVLRDNPRALASKVAGALELAGICLEPEIAGPGFINLRLDPAWVGARVGAIAADPRLGVGAVEPRRIVIDYSSPNVAKKMHVGHLRSTVIGDALARTLRFLGHHVVGDNHLGDWGTQFGILLWAWEHHGDEAALAGDDIGELERLYKLGSEASKADPAVAEACRAELAALQAGDPTRHALWERFTAISRAEAQRTYDRLAVTFDTWHGESFYQPQLAGVVEDLLSSGVARESDGAIAVFFDAEEADGRLADKPFLVRKRDGAFLYSTTDIATIRYRLAEYRPDQIIYVVDVRQANHFEQLFHTVAKMGIEVQTDHVGFGMMLGEDGRPFRTRDGGTVSLAALLDEAEDRILPLVQEKWPDVGAGEQRAIAGQVGIGAVKYADLSPNLTTDYRFEWDKLLAADGNTGPYLQYCLVRTRSILRGHEERFGHTFEVDGSPLVFSDETERQLASALLKLGEVLDRVARQLRPHFLCEYLFNLCRRFSAFYAVCPVLAADDDGLRRSRLTLVMATSRALEIGFDCLNLPQLDRM